VLVIFTFLKIRAPALLDFPCNALSFHIFTKRGTRILSALDMLLIFTLSKIRAPVLSVFHEMLLIFIFLIIRAPVHSAFSWRVFNVRIFNRWI